jgi:nanoRNase/pAp phosphatase (c-di-AMP/oligoRNAs hydrolase)
LLPQAGLNDASKIKVSFRSIGDADTTIYATHWAGGGHKNASSCVMPQQEFAEWLLPA